MLHLELETALSFGQQQNLLIGQRKDAQRYGAVIERTGSLY
jgi:hypothetical protein